MEVYFCTSKYLAKWKNLPEIHELAWRYHFCIYPSIIQLFINTTEKLGFTKMEDWYKVKQADFIQNDGKTLLSYYSLSPRLAVTSILKSHSWEPWKFGGKFQSLTNDDVGDPKVTTRIRNFVEEELKVQCKVTNLEDWYHVPPAVLDKVKRKALVQRSGGLIGIFFIFN